MSYLKKLILFAIVFLVAFNASAQKYHFVNCEQIIAYKNAQAQLAQLSIKWQKEIEEKYASLDKLYKAIQAEGCPFTEEIKKRREDEILQREKEVRDLQQQRFGYEGDLFKKQQGLLKPIEDKIHTAVKKNQN